MFSDDDADAPRSFLQRLIRLALLTAVSLAVVATGIWSFAKASDALEASTRAMIDRYREACERIGGKVVFRRSNPVDAEQECRSRDGTRPLMAARSLPNIFETQ